MIKACTLTAALLVATSATVAMAQNVAINPQMMGTNNCGGLTWIAVGVAGVPVYGQAVARVIFESKGTNLDHAVVGISPAPSTPITVDPIQRNEPDTDLITVSWPSGSQAPLTVSYTLVLTNKGTATCH